jgi:hypothetical protein
MHDHRLSSIFTTRDRALSINRHQLHRSFTQSLHTYHRTPISAHAHITVNASGSKECNLRITMPQLSFDILSMIASIVDERTDYVLLRHPAFLPNDLHAKDYYYSDVYNLSLTCRFFSEVTRPRFFHMVDIRTQTRCDSLLKVLSRNVSLAAHISKVILSDHRKFRASGRLSLVSESARALMPYLCHATTLMISHSHLKVPDVHELGSWMSPLLSTVTFMSIDLCNFKTHEMITLLSYAPRLQHLKVDNSEPLWHEPHPYSSNTSPTSSNDHTISALTLGPITPFSFNRSTLDLYITILRRTGRFRALRKVNIMIRESWAISSCGPLLSDSAHTLEVLQLSLAGRRSTNDPIFDISDLHAPRLRALDVQLDTIRDHCPRSLPVTVTSLMQLLSRIRGGPSRSLQLRLAMLIRREDFNAIQEMLMELDILLATSGLREFATVKLDVECEGARGMEPITHEEVKSSMQRVDEHCQFICKVVNTRPRRGSLPEMPSM